MNPLIEVFYLQIFRNEIPHEITSSLTSKFPVFPHFGLLFDLLVVENTRYH